MIQVTITANIGKDAETRQAGDNTVTGFSAAATSGYGDRKKTIWFSCTIWGKRGESLQQYLQKGTKVTIVGELSEREYNEKTYLEINVNDIDLHGGKQEQKTTPAAQPVQPPKMDDDVPF